MAIYSIVGANNCQVSVCMAKPDVCIMIIQCCVYYTTERQCVAIVGDLFGAGTETTSTTLTWSIIYMTLNQKIQDRVHAEIIDVIGSSGIPSMHNRSHMPYTEACIAEIQRLGDIVPLGVPHATTEDTNLRDFFIPKDTMIIANMYSIHRDPKLWEEPEKFNPERFLDDDGKFTKREEFKPFSSGKTFICR